jgi:pyridoxal phosphate enzyme (YggS family)
MSNLAGRLDDIRARISDECSKLNRDEPTLIVVTKNHPVSLVNELYELGERQFGENRVQEALPKFGEFQQQPRSEAVTWHLIGQLQTNKVRLALEFASVIHSLDREALLLELAKRTIDRPEPLPVFVQVNLTGDNERGGIDPDSLMDFADKVVKVPTLKLEGLMAVASLEENPERDFETMAKLSAALQVEHSTAGGLSIGMSGDYLAALSFGATHLRIGTAITGNRE